MTEPNTIIPKGNSAYDFDYDPFNFDSFIELPLSSTYMDTIEQRGQ